MLISIENGYLHNIPKGMQCKECTYLKHSLGNPQTTGEQAGNSLVLLGTQQVAL